MVECAVDVTGVQTGGASSCDSEPGNRQGAEAYNVQNFKNLVLIIQNSAVLTKGKGACQAF